MIGHLYHMLVDLLTMGIVVRWAFLEWRNTNK